MSVLLPAGQMVVLAEAVMVGFGAMVTETVALLMQPPALVPVTVYTVLASGVADTTAPLGEFNVAAGVQVYVPAPPAVKLAVAPGQIVALAVAVTVGFGATVTCTVVVPVQPLLLVPVMEYTVVAAGVAVTRLPVEALKDPAGDQV